MSYTVYKHTTPSGKVYIGITRPSQLANDWQHGEGYHHNEYFYRAIQKYGWDNIQHEVISDGLTKEQACDMEVELIARYRSNDREFGYNLTDGGDGVHGWKHTPETLSKINTLYPKGNKPWIAGRHWSEETKKKMSESHKGRPSPMKGKHHTKEAVDKMKKSLKKPISQFDKDGNLIRHWDSAKDASDALGISHGNINACCNGKRKTAGKYIWTFRKDEIN